MKTKPKPSKRTSARVAKIASRTLWILEEFPKSTPCVTARINGKVEIITAGEFCALAASCLSQTERPKK